MTTAEITTVELRPFRPEDRAAIVAFQNARRPAHLHETVAEWERSDAQRSPQEVRLLLCAGDPPVAYLSAVDRSTSAYRKEGTCGFSLWVAEDQQRQGIGSALYAQAEQFARERSAWKMITYVRLFAPNEPAVPFLAKRGFAEADRDVPALLDLTAFDPSAFDRPVPDGLRLVSLAEAGDTEENRRKIWALDGVVHRDIPTHDVLSDHPAFDDWVKNLDGPEYDPRAVVVAENAAGEWVGLTVLSFQEDTAIAWTNITGVLPEYRGRGLARALKLRAIDAARARGCTLILTENHEDNAPMRAINKTLGFVPDAPGVTYRKEL